MIEQIAFEPITCFRTSEMPLTTQPKMSRDGLLVVDKDNEETEAHDELGRVNTNRNNRRHRNLHKKLPQQQPRL